MHEGLQYRVTTQTQGEDELYTMKTEKSGDLLTYKVVGNFVVGNFPSSPPKIPTSPSYLPHKYILRFYM